MNFRHWIAGLAAVSVAGLATSGFAQGVTTDRLMNAGSEAEAGNWLMVHKTYDANRYSSLSEINAGNVLGKGYTAGVGMSIGTAFGRIAGTQAALAAQKIKEGSSHAIA